MPRGVAIPEVREQLFAAADRILGRAGPAGLTTRAITAEAGVANGVMHRHFRDLDAFLAEFAASRLAAIAGTAASLPSRAGQGTVAANLTDAALTLFGANALALMNLVAARPELAPALEHAAPGPGGSIGDVEGHFAAYLDAEKDLGRIAPGTDTQTLAFTLIGAIHHLVITNPGGLPDLPQRVRRIVTALIAGMGPAPDS
jgi:AcrR family transcriptional regulator